MTMLVAPDDRPADISLATDAAGGVAAAGDQIVLFDDHEIRPWQLIEKPFELDAFLRQEVPRRVAVERSQAISAIGDSVWACEHATSALGDLHRLGDFESRPAGLRTICRCRGDGESRCADPSRVGVAALFGAAGK